MPNINKIVNVFISHKHEDEQTALLIRDELMTLDNPRSPRINFFLSEEILGGEDWYKWIKDRLEETNLFLLLFTDSARSWDWCLYEAGLFDRLDGKHVHRIVCLYSRSNEPPKPLKHLQAFSAEPSKLRTFLQQLFVGTELLGLTEPLADWLERVPERLDAVSQNISQLIDRVPTEIKYFNKYFVIEVQDPNSIAPDSIPFDAIVEATEDTFAIFDKQSGPWPWKNIEEKARQNEDQRWLEELASAIYKSSKGDVPTPIHAVFHSLKDAKMYTPILYRSDRMADGKFIFKVLFNEDVSWQVDDVPGPMRSLATSLLMATRFKYELIEKYSDKIQNSQNQTTLEKYYTEMLQVIMQIESEASSRGLLERRNLLQSYSGRDQKKVDEMYNKWYVVREKLFGGFETHKQDTIHDCLKDLAKLNKDYLKIASRRYHQVITLDDHWLNLFNRLGL